MISAAAVAVPSDRAHIVDRLHQALWALEHDDAEGWREHVDALIEWRTQPFVQGLTRLARELEAALGEGTGASGASLPDACSRLEHVVTLTENASMRTLDLIQECSQLLATLPVAGDDAATKAVAGIRSRLSEMTAAQGYQDLTGQIILRVVELVRAVHAGLGEATGNVTPLQLSNRGHGPSIAGLDEKPATQDDANDLLSSLGI